MPLLWELLFARRKIKKRKCNRYRRPLTENKGYGKIVRTEIKAFISD